MTDQMVHHFANILKAVDLARLESDIKGLLAADDELNLVEAVPFLYIIRRCLQRKDKAFLVENFPENKWGTELADNIPLVQQGVKGGVAHELLLTAG